MGFSESRISQPETYNTLLSDDVSVWHVIRAYVVLTKPRILSLLAFTAYAAMIFAGHRIPSLRETVVTLLGLLLCAGGSAVINMWYDQDIDALMKRTKQRPLPTGLVKSRHAFWFGVLMTLFGTVELFAFVNPLSSLLGLLGAVYYGVLYTMLLKRRTPENIVIGGGAGAFPPLIGFAAVAGHLSITAWWMFALIFLWTPGHFWALALFKAEDYQKAGVPMMPVVRGPKTTKRKMLGYTVMLFLATGVAPFVGIEEPLAGLLFAFCAWFVISHLFLLVNHRFPEIWAKRTFLSSLIVLPALFAIIAISGLI